MPATRAFDIWQVSLEAAPWKTRIAYIDTIYERNRVQRPQDRKEAEVNLADQLVFGVFVKVRHVDVQDWQRVGIFAVLVVNVCGVLLLIAGRHDV